MTKSNVEKETRDINDQGVAKYTMLVATMLTGIEAHRIRRFEEAGLLRPARTEAGQRLYSDTEIAVVREVAKLENEGINLPGVKAILEMRRGERN